MTEELQGLARLRVEIDRIDDQILDLIEERLAASTDIAARKNAEGDRYLKVRPRRQVRILQRLKQRSNRAQPGLIEQVWREIMAHCLQAQARLELVLAPSDQSELLEARVRAQFGSAAPIRWAASISHAIRSALAGEAIAIIPEPISSIEGELRVFDVLRADDGRPLGYAIGRVAAEDVVIEPSEPIQTKAPAEPDNWSPESWRSRPAEQLAHYSDPEALTRVERRLAGSQSLVDVADILHLRASLARVANGQGMIVQGGDCAESFAEFDADKVRRYLQPAAAHGRDAPRGDGRRGCPSSAHRRPVRQASLVGDRDDRRRQPCRAIAATRSMDPHSLRLHEIPTRSACWMPIARRRSPSSCSRPMRPPLMRTCRRVHREVGLKRAIAARGHVHQP